MKIRTGRRWRNTIGTFSVWPLRQYLPQSLGDLQQAVREAQQAGVRLRAVGSGHSYSDVALATGFQVNLKHLNQVLPLDINTLQPQAAEQPLLQVQAGMTIQQLNKELDRRRLAVTNMGGIDNQTIAGAIATGTHGTGIDYPAIHGMVRSMVLVADGGRAYRIEPTNGPTLPRQHDEPGVDLIQDDDYFYSVLVSLGCMGIVYSYLLEVEDQYWLRESKQLITWPEARRKLEAGQYFRAEDAEGRPLRGAQLQINPYCVKKAEAPSCLEVRHYLLRDGLPKRSIGQRTRALVSSVFGGLPITYLATIALLKIRPAFAVQLIESSLRSVQDREFTGRAHRVLYQGFEYVKQRAYSAEFAFDATNGQYIAALEAMITYLEQAAQMGNHYQTSPFGLRFVRASGAYLSADAFKTIVDME